MEIDYRFVFQQSFLIALYPLIPLLFFAWNRRHFEWKPCLGLVCVTGLGLAVDSVLSANGYGSSMPPATGPCVGPSWHSIQRMWPYYLCGYWMPLWVLFCGIRYHARLKGKRWEPEMVRRVVVKVFSVVGALGTFFIFHVSGMVHEDTTWAPGLTPARWAQVEAGMTRSEVLSILGSPLKKEREDRSLETYYWADYGRTGYRVVVRFENGKALEPDPNWFFYRYYD